MQRGLRPCLLSASAGALQGGLVYLGMAVALVAEAAFKNAWTDVVLMVTYIATLYFPSLAALSQRGAALIVPIYMASHVCHSLLDLCVGLDLWLGGVPASICSAQEKSRTELLVELMCTFSGILSVR